MSLRLLHEQLESGVVQSKMMRQKEKEPTALLFLMRDHGLHQRRSTDVETDTARIEARAHFHGGLDLHIVDAQRRMAPYDLHRL